MIKCVIKCEVFLLSRIKLIMIRFTARFGFCSKPNPYTKVQQTLKVNGKEYKFFSLPALGDKRLGIFCIFNLRSTSLFN